MKKVAMLLIGLVLAVLASAQTWQRIVGRGGAFDPPEGSNIFCSFNTYFTGFGRVYNGKGQVRLIYTYPGNETDSGWVENGKAVLFVNVSAVVDAVGLRVINGLGTNGCQASWFN